MTYEKSALVAFGERLRLVRTRAGLSQIVLAQRAQVSQATISRVERGEYPKLNVTAVDRLATALNVPEQRLLAGTGFVPLGRVLGEWRTKPTWK